MSREQSEKIITASGGVYAFCECKDWAGHFGKCWKCGYRKCPDLFLPKNRHILVVYVGLICDTDEKWEKFEDYAEESADWASAQTGLSYRRWLFLLPSAAIMTALLRVISEGSEASAVQSSGE